MKCEICKEEGTNIRINTTEFGKICFACWCDKMGELIEEHPIVDIK